MLKQSCWLAVDVQLAPRLYIFVPRSSGIRISVALPPDETGMRMSVYDFRTNVLSGLIVSEFGET